MPCHVGCKPLARPTAAAKSCSCSCSTAAPSTSTKPLATSRTVFKNVADNTVLERQAPRADVRLCCADGAIRTLVNFGRAERERPKADGC